MKAVILAGGLGSRISEETHIRPKPMVEIGGRPILWHILKSYAAHNVTEFIICCGYKGYVIKEYFANYFLHMSDVTFDLRDNQTIVHHAAAEPWKVTVIDTGESTMTGGRLRRVKDYIGSDTFCFTYGDGVSNVDITALIDFHRMHGLQSTVTAVQPPGRFGAVTIQTLTDKITAFQEKPNGDSSWVNGGYFVLEPSVLDLIDGDDTVWEGAPLRELATRGQLSAFRHTGFWQPMDTLADKQRLEELWVGNRAPWKVW